MMAARPATTGRRTAVRAVAMAVAAVAVVVAAGCGVGVDEQPRALGVTTTTSVAPQPATTDGVESSSLYVVRDDRVLPFTRELADQLPRTVLDALVTTRAEDVPVAGASTAVPAGTTVLGTRLEGGTLTVDLSRRFGRVVGPARQAAVAQIVLTLTELPGVERVRFEVAGDPVTVPTPDQGDADVVDECDMAPLLADPDSEDSAGLSARSAARLTARSDELRTNCG